MNSKLETLLIEKFGTSNESIRFFRAPARINIIGEHVDYLGGLVLPAAIDFEVKIAIRKNESSMYNFYSVQFDELLSLKEISFQNEKKWANYIFGVIDEILKSNKKISGFDLIIDGTIPTGAGLSSSAALEVCVCYALNEIFNLSFSREKIALLGQAAENNFVGTKCGIMDQFIIANAIKDKCLLLDTSNLEKTYHTLELENFEFYLINSNIKHSLNDSDYNLRREECESALLKIQKFIPTIKNLYQLNEISLDWNLTQIETNRVKHVLGEKSRTQSILKFFAEKNLSEAAKCLYESHDSLANLFEVSCVEIDFLINELKQNQVAGARMIGGGFGGCILVLDEKNHKEKVIPNIQKKYFDKFSVHTEIYSFQISEGVAELN